MTHAELVEKVARIIAPYIFDREDGVRYPFTEQEARKKATDAIAAVHAALQEPSGEMIWAADPHAGPAVSFRVWKAMLDASPLKEGK